jgi:hypothetical protein
MRGATSLEYQFFFKRIWIRFLYPKYWCKRNWPFIRITICDKDGNVPAKKTKSNEYTKTAN